MDLTGKNVKLVRFNNRFITANYIGWLNDPHVNRYMYTGRIPVSKEQMGDPNDSQNIYFAIMTNIYVEDGKIAESKLYDSYIGTLSINTIDWISRRGELGYMIGDKKYWRMGLATEAVGLAVDYAFRRLNLHKITAGMVDGNIGSQRALEKNGFVKCGIKPEDYYLDGKYLSTHRFYKTKTM